MSAYTLTILSKATRDSTFLTLRGSERTYIQLLGVALTLQFLELRTRYVENIRKSGMLDVGRL
jgi:hypothetical protein